jgi:hypothetical protein
LAKRRTISLASEEGFDKLMVVSNCLSLIQRLHASELDHSSVGVVVQDIKSLAANFTSISFDHVRHHCNELEHILARSVELFVSSIFRNSAPDFIRKTLCGDLL